VKVLHIETDLVLQSSKGTLKLESTDSALRVNFENWNTVSVFFGLAKIFPGSLRDILDKTKYLDQSIELLIGGRRVLELREGKLLHWKLLPLIRLWYYRFIAR
jgi:hypothetical protein